MFICDGENRVCSLGPRHGTVGLAGLWELSHDETICGEWQMRVYKVALRKRDGIRLGDMGSTCCRQEADVKECLSELEIRLKGLSF